MAQAIDELIVNEPTDDVVRAVLQTIEEADGELRAIHICAERSFLVDFISMCADEEIQFDDRGSDSGDVLVARTKKEKSESSTGDDPSATWEFTGQAADGSHPPSGENETPEDWIDETADVLGTDRATLLGILSQHSIEIEDQQKRQILELAFTQHRERDDKADCACVEIRLGESSTLGRYQYFKDRTTGHGIHYLRNLTPRMKTDIQRYAAREDFTVIDQGKTFISVSSEKSTAAEDVRFVENILSDVFDCALSEITVIDEVIDRDTTRSWFSSR